MSRKAAIIGVIAIVAIGACSVDTTPPPTPLQLPYDGPFELATAPEPSSPRDYPSPFSLPSEGFTPLAFVANSRSALLGELDVFEMGDRTHIAQRIHPSGYVLTDVTNPTQPIDLGTWILSPPSTGEHIKIFRQRNRWYLALPLELDPRFSFGCGLAIIEITDPLMPVLHGVQNGVTTGADAAWCQVHSVGIETDNEGNAEYLLATSQDTWDLRVLDIRDLEEIRETNAYHLHVHPHNRRAWAHQLNIVGNRVYVSYYDGGVMILDKFALVAGDGPDEVELTVPGAIAAPEFQPHDAHPTEDGDFLFVNDAFLSEGGLRLFDIRDPANPQPIMIIDPEELKSQRHTLLVQDDLLIIPWRTHGVRVYRYDLSQADNPIIEVVAFQEVREQPLDTGEGVTAVQSHPCLIEGAMRTCVYATDATRGLLILALDDS